MLHKAIPALAALAVTALTSTAQAKPKPAPPPTAKYYVQVLEALVDQGVPATIKTEARAALLAALKERPEVVLAPDGPITDEAALAAELKKKKQRGLALSVRITELKREIKPPPEGKASRTLQISIKAQIFGSTIPADGLAIGGDGSSVVGMEIGKKIFPGDEAELVKEALTQALTQAANTAIQKLSTPALVPKAEKKRKKK